MTEFTPGPWAIDEFGSIIGPNGKTILIPGVALPGYSKPEAKANRRLTAEAPAMYEALVELLYTTDHMLMNATDLKVLWESQKKARAAIAKVEK